MVTEEHSQPRVLKSDIAGGLLHFQGGFNATALKVLELPLQPLDILLMTGARAALIVTNTDGG